MKRAALWLALALGAPCVVLLVALPVGFVMEIGKQIPLRVTNASGRPLRVTLLGVSKDSDVLRVAPLTMHGFLPLPALRAADVAIEPGASKVLLYSARRFRPRALLAEGRELALTGSVVIDASTPFAPASEAARKAVERHSQAYPWAGLLAGPLGTLAFLRARRALRV